MERWLVLFNCQTSGLTHSFQLLCPQVHVTGVDIVDYGRRTSEIDASLDTFNRIIMCDEIKTVPNANHSRAGRVDLLPSFSFGAYHPDLSYIVADNAYFLDGPTSHYHSAIAFAAHQRGLSIDKTAKLYNHTTYERLGYYDRWEKEREIVMARYQAVGMDLGPYLQRWSRSGCFMYSSNHPRVHVLYDLAALFLRKDGYPSRHSDLLPHDDLVKGPCYPVYNEIGECFGVSGSYLFKHMGGYRLLDLNEYLKASFEVYDRYEAGSLSVAPWGQSLHDRLLAWL